MLIDDLPIDRLKIWGIRLPYSSSDRRASLWLLWSQPASLRHVKVGLLKLRSVSRPRFWGSAKHSLCPVQCNQPSCCIHNTDIYYCAACCVVLSRYKYINTYKYQICAATCGCIPITCTILYPREIFHDPKYPQSTVIYQLYTNYMPILNTHYMINIHQ